MNEKQHTLKDQVSFEGNGLHTGAFSAITLKPAPLNHGIAFHRVDLGEDAIVKADVDYVVDISRGTTIEHNGARVHTVEHLLAAITGEQIDNVIIEISGPEVPILDGSSKPFADKLHEVGTVEQNAIRDFFVVPEGVFYKDDKNKVDIAALPLNDYRLTVMVDYNSKVLGSQHASLNNIEDFRTEIAPCRTFCFFHELEALHSQNLVKGGTLDNAIVIVDKEVEQQEIDQFTELFNLQEQKLTVNEGILNNIELRFNNEMARHKLLDVVGDLALLGRPIKGQILAARPGHASNVAFTKLLKQKMKQSKSAQGIPVYDETQPPVMDVNAIYDSLPHRFPFKLVDKIIHLDKTTVVGLKNATINEEFFVGHYPGSPVMPGVLIIEAMAQTGGILILQTVDNPKEWTPYFLSIDKCRFKKPVTPGDTVLIKCVLTSPIRMGLAKIQGHAYVAGECVAEAMVSAMIIKKEA